MMILPEPTPAADEGWDLATAIHLRDLFILSQNLSLTSRDGAIQQADKAGNLDAVYVVFTSNGTANTEDTVTHTLGRVPRGYLPVKQDKAAILYDGVTAFTSTALYLKSSATSVAWTVLVF